MRWAALVLGLFGALVMLAVGSLWTDNASHLAEVEQMAQTVNSAVGSSPAADRARLAEMNQSLEEVRRRARASYPMAGLGLVAFVAAALVFKFPKVSGAIMALSAIVPAFLAPTSLIFGWMLLLAALFALLVKPRRKATKAAAA